MSNLKAIPILLCLLAGILAPATAGAQEVMESFPAQKTGATYMGYRVEKGDTVYYDSEGAFRSL